MINTIGPVEVSPKTRPEPVGRKAERGMEWMAGGGLGWETPNTKAGPDADKNKVFLILTSEPVKT